MPSSADTLPVPIGTLRRHRTRERFFASAGPVIAIIGWEAIGQIYRFPFFPPLSAVVWRLWELMLSGEIFGNLLSSLSNFALGLAFCVIVGVPLGLAMGILPRLRSALNIYVNAFLTAPSLVLAPIFFTIFGLSRWAIVSVIISYGLFIIIVSSEGAVASVDDSLVEMAVAYGASRQQVVAEIIIPGTTPLVFAGLRLGAGRCVKGMINGEMFIAAVGLGAIIINAGRRFDATTVLAVLILTVFVALGVSAVIRLIDRRLTRWLPDTSRSAV